MLASFAEMLEAPTGTDGTGGLTGGPELGAPGTVSRQAVPAGEGAATGFRG